MSKRISFPFSRQDSGLLIIIAAGLFAALFPIFAIIGVLGMFSPTPSLDMWDGGLGFYQATLSGDHSRWLAQHNEHRIVLSRMLFWLDYELFGGMTIFLIVMNYVIVAFAVILLWRIALARVACESDSRCMAFLVACFVTAWLYQWMQFENFAWSFQSQFFLAQILPLLAFYLLYKSVALVAMQDRVPASMYFILACLTGLACAGTMANGVLALPLMTAYALVVRMRWWQYCILALLTVLTLGLYFQNYVSPGHHGSVSEAILQHPLQLALYVAYYLGGPFYFLLGQTITGLIAAISSTVIMALVSFVCLCQCIKSPRTNALKLALVFTVIYLVGTALGTGGGRLIFGVGQALSPRYTTPALLAWVCILMLVLPWLQKVIRRFPLTSSGVIAVLAMLMLAQQSKALHPQFHRISDRNVAGLALELGVRDEEKLNDVYPSPDVLIPLAENASRENLAIFGAYPWRDLRQTMGTIATHSHLPGCIGSVDTATIVHTDSDYLRISGWLINNERIVPELIAITNTGGQIAGYALSGIPRPDVTDTIEHYSGRAGFQGYVRKDMVGSTVILVPDTDPCELVTDLP